MEQNLPGKALVDRFLDPRFPDGKDCRSSDLGQEFLRRRPQHLFFVNLVSAILHHNRCPPLVTSGVLSTVVHRWCPTTTTVYQFASSHSSGATAVNRTLGGYWKHLNLPKPPDGRLTKSGQNGTRVDNQTLHISSDNIYLILHRKNFGMTRESKI